MLISALAVTTLLGAIWLSFELRRYELLDGRTDTGGTGLSRSSDFRVACDYLSFTGRETFVRAYFSPIPRDAYACPLLRKHGDEALMQTFQE